MSFNIMDLVSEQLGDQASGQIGNLLGDQSSMAKGGLEAVVPALLSGFTQRAAAPGGADVLFDAVSKQDDGFLDSLGDSLSGDNSNSMIEMGTSLLSGLFGNSGLGSIAGIIAGLTGLSKGNTGSLMGIVAPILIGIIKKKVMGGGLNASGLLDMLNGQQDNINAAMPQGLSDQLNSSGFLGSLGNAASDAVGSASDAASSAVGNASDIAGDAVSGGSSMFRKLIPIIGLALLAWLGWNFFGNSAKDVADSAATAVSDAASTATEAMDLDPAKLGTDLTGLFDTAKTNLEGITDADSATAAIPKLTEMGEQFGGMAGLIEKVPEAARGPLTGIVSTGLGMLEPLLEKVRAIPGVGAIIDPIVTPMLEQLKALAG